MSVEKFLDRDDDCLSWVEEHRTGYVINVGWSGRGYARMHHAACPTITSRPHLLARTSRSAQPRSPNSISGLCAAAAPSSSVAGRASHPGTSPAASKLDQLGPPRLHQQTPLLLGPARWQRVSGRSTDPTMSRGGCGCGVPATSRLTISILTSTPLALRSGSRCDPWQRQPTRSCMQVSLAPNRPTWTWRTWSSTTSTPPHAAVSSRAPGMEYVSKRQPICTAICHPVGPSTAPTSTN